MTSVLRNKACDSHQHLFFKCEYVEKVCADVNKSTELQDLNDNRKDIMSLLEKMPLATIILIIEKSLLNCAFSI